jgi:hypothetical protein
MIYDALRQFLIETGAEHHRSFLGSYPRPLAPKSDLSYTSASQQQRGVDVGGA